MLVFALLVVELLLYLIAYYLTNRDIFRPSTVMLGVFIISTSIACANVVNWNIDFSPKTLFILSLGLLSATLTDILIFRRCSKKKNIERGTISPLSISNKLVLLIIVIETISLFLYYGEIIRLAYLDGYESGTNLLWHFRNITSYQAEERVSWYITVLIRSIDAIAYIFAFAFIKNIFAGKKWTKQLLLLGPVAIFVIKVLMSSGRQDILRLVAFSLITSAILYSFNSGWEKSYTKKYCKILMITIPIVLIGFYLATNLIGRSTSRSFYEYITTYVGGSIQQFNQYVCDPSLSEETHFGAETFPAIYSVLHRFGLVDYVRPVHLELRQLGVTSGNVYTFFRRPLHDFGLAGMLIMTIVVVGLFSYWYSTFSKRKITRNTDLSIIIFSYLYYWIVLSSIENYSIGIVSAGSLFTVISIAVMYRILFPDDKSLVNAIGGKCGKALAADPSIHIDERSIGNIRKLLPYRYEKTQIRLGDMLRDYNDGLYDLSKTLPYRYFVNKGNIEIEKEYKRYCSLDRNRVDNDQRSPETFRELIDAIHRNGYDDSQSSIVVDQFNIVLDGQHRGSILLAELGEDTPIDVVKVWRLRVRPRTLFRVLTYNLCGK